LDQPGLFAVGGVTGLALHVHPGGARSWILRITVSGRRREIGLGGFPDISLATARELARQAREKVARGENPIAERRAMREMHRRASSRLTFDEAARRWHAVRAHRNAKHASQVLSTLATYASPVLGKKAVDEIDLRDILAVLEPIWTTKTETADRLRGRMENVLAWATAAKHRSGENPARWRGNLDALLPKPGKIAIPKHHAALAFDDVPAIIQRLASVDGMGARALEFLILTAARSGEVRLAVWTEVDLGNRMWVVPGVRMKAGREHRVPLSEAALSVLARLPRFAGSDLIFVGPRGGAISDMTVSAVTRRMDVPAVPHGFRSAFRDWAAERTSYPAELAEMALAHTISNKVEAAYRRGDLFEKRRALMDDWGRFAGSAKMSSTGEMQ
jgi:integrase